MKKKADANRQKALERGEYEVSEAESDDSYKANDVEEEEESDLSDEFSKSDSDGSLDGNEEEDEEDEPSDTESLEETIADAKVANDTQILEVNGNEENEEEEDSSLARNIKKALRPSRACKMVDQGENEEDEGEDDTVTPKTPPRRRTLYRLPTKHSEYDFQKGKSKATKK